ncbi:MAG TPA: hypothetical protein VJ521_07045, partial [Acidobacteriota bacterium]|nr:hypothetical protein [Acidobacteriota bacterium]
MELWIEEVPPFAILPVVHHSYEFTIAAREAFEKLRPCAVALEYPAIFEELILRAFKRLPRISVLAFGNRRKKYIRLEPVDPFAEAGRSALETGLPLKCVDLAADYLEVFEPAPDTYSLAFLGHKEYCRMMLEGHSLRFPQDEARELAMAFHLQEFRTQIQESSAPILVLCGISHVKGLASRLAHRQPRPFEQPQQGRLFHLSSASLGEVMGAFPFLTSVYELQRAGNADVEALASVREDVADDFDRLAPDTAEASKQALKVIDGKKPEAFDEFVRNAHLDTARGAVKRDRHDILTRFILWSRAYFEREVEERINPQHLFLLENFSRKYAFIKKMLLPDFYELLIAGRGCVGSHFCYRMWQIGTAYPPQHGPSELEILELRAGDIFPLVQKVRMNPHAPLRPRAGLPAFLRKREKHRK